MALIKSQRLTKITPIAYGLVGIAVFAINGQIDSHPHLQIYLVLLEAKLGIVFVYLLSKALGKANSNNRSYHDSDT